MKVLAAALVVISFCSFAHASDSQDLYAMVEEGAQPAGCPPGQNVLIVNLQPGSSEAKDALIQLSTGPEVSIRAASSSANLNCDGDTCESEDILTGSVNTGNSDIMIDASTIEVTLTHVGVGLVAQPGFKAMQIFLQKQGAAQVACYYDLKSIR